MISDRPKVLEERISSRPGVPLICALQRHRDQLLDLLRRESRHLGGDLRGDVAELRIGLDRERLPGVDAEARRAAAASTMTAHPLVQAEADELVNH